LLNQNSVPQHPFRSGLQLAALLDQDPNLSPQCVQMLRVAPLTLNEAMSAG